MYNSNARALGQYAEAAAAIYGAFKGNGGPQPSTGGAPVPISPTAPPSTTTVSPVMQQAFTPQISPTIQVTTDSPGARIGATTTQRAGGGQYAAGGGAGNGSRIPSGAGGMPITPLTPPTFREEFYYPPLDAVREVMAPAPFNWTPVIYVVGGLVAVMVFLQATKKRPQRTAA